MVSRTCRDRWAMAPHWLLPIVLLAGCAPIRHSQQQHTLEIARATLGETLVSDDWAGKGRGRILEVAGDTITPEMAEAVNESVLVEELRVEEQAPERVASVLERQFEELAERRPSHDDGRCQVWRRRNMPQMDWVDRTFGVTMEAGNLTTSQNKNWFEF